MYDFTDKNIVVAGGSSGIGLRLSLDLKRMGGNVSVWSRSSNDELKSQEIPFFSLDVTQPFDQNPPELPGLLHGLVYCPGNVRLTPFRRLKDEDFVEDFNLNVLGAIRTIRFCLDPLLEAEGASIVLISTVAVRLGMKFHASVATVKSALEGLAKSLAAEFSGKKLRVNVVAPSITNTPLSSRLLETKEKRARSASQFPLGRYGEPEDIASMAAFLLSEKASWITGQIFSVDGGMSSIRIFS